LARDSGKSQGKRPVRGGRREVRAILFVVAGVVRYLALNRDALGHVGFDLGI